MDDASSVTAHSGPFRRIVLRVAIISLAHPKELGREPHLFVGVRAASVNSPTVFVAQPDCGLDAVTVADMLPKTVFLYHLTHVLHDLFGCRDGRPLSRA